MDSSHPITTPEGTDMISADVSFFAWSLQHVHKNYTA